MEEELEMGITTSGTTTSGTYIPPKPKILDLLGCYSYKLLEPLEFKVETTKDGVMAFIDKPIAECGFGKTESEAVDDLKTSIIDYFHSLQRHRAQLARDERAKLHWLEKHVEVKWFGC